MDSQIGPGVLVVGTEKNDVPVEQASSGRGCRPCKAYEAREGVQKIPAEQYNRCDSYIPFFFSAFLLDV